MLESIAVVLALLSIGLSACLAVAVARLTRKNEQMQKALSALQSAIESQVMPAAVRNSDTSLSGYRIVLAISQDHALPTFSLLLKDALSACDAEVTLIDTQQAESLANQWGKDIDSAGEQPDVLIWGTITCNGYSEFYYKALLNYLTPYGALNPTSEQPAQGYPQKSLAVDVVSKLKKELCTAQGRVERGRAVQELRQEGLLRQIER